MQINLCIVTKYAKNASLSVWHNFQLSEPSVIPDTCRRKCSLPYHYHWQRSQGKAYALPAMSSQRIHGVRDGKDNAFCVTLNLLCYSSGCLILWIRDLYLFHLFREVDSQICITLSIPTAVYIYLYWARDKKKKSSGPICLKVFHCTAAVWGCFHSQMCKRTWAHISLALIALSSLQENIIFCVGLD